jgi:hypothetical protein
MNITPHAGSPDARVIHWIQHHYLHHLGAFSLLFATLRASDDPRFLRNIFLEVAGAVGLLTFWRDAGTDTFGLAGIAELLRLHPEVLELSGALRRTEGTVSGAFEKNTGHLYLYKMLSARHSYFHENEPEMLAWSRTLRIWTLVQALSRAQKGNFRDRFLEEICNSLRKAAESEEKQDWLRASDLLKTNQRTFDQISLHLAFTGARLASKANEHTFAQVIPPISTGPRSRTVMQPWPDAALG